LRSIEENRGDFYYLCEIRLTLKSRVCPWGLGTCGLANWGLDSGCWGLLELRVLFNTYSDEENPVFELVDVIVLVDRSIIGAFELVLLLTAPAAETVVVNVGDGELDDVL
jgi:hypothetical protein